MDKLSVVVWSGLIVIAFGIAHSKSKPHLAGESVLVCTDTDTGQTSVMEAGGGVWKLYDNVYESRHSSYITTPNEYCRVINGEKGTFSEMQKALQQPAPVPQPTKQEGYFI